VLAWSFAAAAFAASSWLPVLAQAETERARTPAWAVDPADPGPDAPPVGRSLFDFVVSADEIPFPFERLVQLLEQRAGCKAPQRCVEQVLIPLGRSLQRTAAMPEFFKYPRIVAAVVAAPRATPLLKDRIYLGYQEQAAVIEVISYNETAGRFEFQIVRNYRAEAKPALIYARRAVCAACHQNLSPIFSRPLWEETNANAEVAAALERADARTHGVRVRRGVDAPGAIDASTDRANKFAVWQRLWQEGCGTDDMQSRGCRAAVFVAALQYRLSGHRAFDQHSAQWREAFVPAFARGWQERWPAGLAIPNPDVPNRNALLRERWPSGERLVHVSARHDALLPRAPLEVWTSAQEAGLRLVAGLAESISPGDARLVSDVLDRRAAGAKRRRYVAPCKFAWLREWLRFECVGAEGEASALRLSGRIGRSADAVGGGELYELQIGAAALEQLDVRVQSMGRRGATVRLAPDEAGGAPRLPDGSAIASVQLRWGDAEAAASGGPRFARGEARVTVREDFAPLRDAMAASAASDAFSAQPFNATVLVRSLLSGMGSARHGLCCGDPSLLPAVVVEAPGIALDEPPARRLAAFYALCATCHATSQPFPAPFLAGSNERVAASIRQCAPRIQARLAMWDVAPGAREKTPMPPTPYAQRADKPIGVAQLQRVVAEILRESPMTRAAFVHLPPEDYERLPPCVPGGEKHNANH